MKVTVEVELNQDEVEMLRTFEFGSILGMDLHDTAHAILAKLEKVGLVEMRLCPILTELGKQVKEQLEKQG